MVQYEEPPASPSRPRAFPRLPALSKLPISPSPLARHRGATPLGRSSPSCSLDTRSPSGTPSPAFVWPTKAQQRPRLSGEYPLKGASMPRGVCGYATAVRVDAETACVYLYGGYKRPAMKEPVGDLWQLDTNTYEWVDMTNEFSSLDDLKYTSKVDPKDPAERSSLPLLRGACMTYSVVNDTKLLFITGARTMTPECGRRAVHQADFIAIDLERKVYWDAAPRNGAIKPRMDAVITIEDGYLYVFGGTDIADGEDAEYNVLDTYCIARFLPEEKHWAWVVKDQPYGRTIPTLGYSMSVQPVYRGVKLALFPGMTRKSRIDITAKDIVFFDTRERKFSVQTSTPGSFPTKCLRYGVGSPGSPSTSAGNSSEVMYIVTWTTDPPEGDIVNEACDLELWEYKLPPEQKFRPLNLTSAIGQLDLDPEDFFVVGSRLLLIGTKLSTRDARGTELNTCIEIHL